ncbi:MAG: M15 family metallopeptidase [Myxococcota bacterium]
MADDAASGGAAQPPPDDLDTQDIPSNDPHSDELGSHDDEAVQRDTSETTTRGDAPSAKRQRSQVAPWQSRRGTWLLAASLALCATIALDVLLMHRAAEQTSPAPSAMSSSSQPAGSAARAPSPSPLALDLSTDAVPPLAKSASPPGESDETGLPAFDEDDIDSEPARKKKKQPPHFGSVQEAAARSCSTASVDGLSRQIIEQGRCINPKAFVPLPSRPNLVIGEHVFPYLEASARDRLVRVLDSRRNGTMTINSALRTVAQQYLVWRWSASKRCGVQLATPPGESNHETGLALDIAEQAEWRALLEAHDFHWLGAIDRVHFDYKGNTSSPASQRATDVLAFQQLWNRNNPNDLIAETGRYNSETEQRLKKAPADGFAIGLACKGRRPKPLANSGKRSR